MSTTSYREYLLFNPSGIQHGESELLAISVGQTFELRPDPNNSFDPFAVRIVAVLDNETYQIGWLPKNSLAQKFYHQIRRIDPSSIPYAMVTMYKPAEKPWKRMECGLYGPPSVELDDLLQAFAGS